LAQAGCRRDKKAVVGAEHKGGDVSVREIFSCGSCRCATQLGSWVIREPIYCGNTGCSSR